MLLFDWAENQDELEQIAVLEGLTNDRLHAEYGNLNLVSKEDWVSGAGATILMAAFTHIGHPSRFCDETFGVYYAADSQETAIKETVYHRERFYRASNEAPCKISMREYIAKVVKPLVEITNSQHRDVLDPNPEQYKISQEFGKKIRAEKHWGLYYPSVRNQDAYCVAIFRPPALTTPIQATHFEYIWDGLHISHVNKAIVYSIL